MADEVGDRDAGWGRQRCAPSSLFSRLRAPAHRRAHCPGQENIAHDIHLVVIGVQQSIGSACEFDGGDFEHGRNGRNTTHMELADEVKDIHAANTCKVAKFLGSKDIVPLHIQKTVTSLSASGEAEECYFDFRKKRFFYFEEKDNFFKLRYLTKDLFGHYIKGSGYGTEAKINTTRQVAEKHV